MGNTQPLVASCLSKLHAEGHNRILCFKQESHTVRFEFLQDPLSEVLRVGLRGVRWEEGGQQGTSALLK